MRFVHLSLFGLALLLVIPIANAEGNCICDYRNSKNECMQETCLRSTPYRTSAPEYRYRLDTDIYPGRRQTYYFTDGSNYYYDSRRRDNTGQCFDTSNDRRRCASQFYFLNRSYEYNPGVYDNSWRAGDCYDHRLGRRVVCFEDYRTSGYDRYEEDWWYDYDRYLGDTSDYWDRRRVDYDDYLQDMYYHY